jgi:glycosyltransferase involved in cell wall biosynthesis
MQRLVEGEATTRRLPGRLTVSCFCLKLGHLAAIPNGTMLSVVVPVYKEEGNVSEFLARVVPALESITKDFEVIFALDPSPDRTENLILDRRERDERIKLLKFSRRFGQPMATLAGLQYARGAAMIVMDVDLQDPPDLIPQMVAKWREGFDVVIPQRTSRTGEPWIKRATSAWGYRVINRIAEVDIPPNTGDFRLLSRRVVDELVRLDESHGFLRGLTAVVGFRQALIPFERPARFAGATSYNRLLGDLRIGTNGVFSFSRYPLTIAMRLGALCCGLALCGAIIAIMVKRDVTLLCVVVFLGGIQLISVGILGQYIGRIYDEVKRRPKFIVDRAVGLELPAGEP